MSKFYTNTLFLFSCYYSAFFFIFSLSITFIISCKASLVMLNSLSLIFLEISVSLLYFRNTALLDVVFLFDRVVLYIYLFVYFSNLNISSHYLLNCKVSAWKFANKYKEFPSYVMSLSSATAAKSLQSCLTLCDPIDGSLPGSPIPEILRARTLQWVAISFSNAGK